MFTLKHVATTGLGAVLLLAGCASSTEDEDVTDVTEAPEEALAELGDGESAPMDALPDEAEGEENIGTLSDEIRRGRGRGYGRGWGRGHGRGWGRGYGRGYGRGFRGPWVGGGYYYNPRQAHPGAVWGWRPWRGGRQWGWRWPVGGGWAWSACDPAFDWRCRDLSWY